MKRFREFLTPERRGQESIADLDGDERVDIFLAAHAELFAESNQRWRAVKEARQEFMGHAPQVGRGNREQRREADATSSRTFSSALNVFGTESNWIYEKFIAPKVESPELTDEEKRQHAQSIIQRTEPTLERSKLVYNQLNPKAGQALDAGKALQDRYFEARLSEDLSLQKIAHLLEDDEAVLPFVERLHEATELADSGVSDIPGLAELLATYIAKTGKANILHAAIDRVTQDPHDFIHEFINRYLWQAETDKGTAPTKETILAMNAIRFSLDAFADFLPDQAALTSRLTVIYDTWPDSLKSALNAYTNARRVQTYLDIENALRPFTRHGRLLLERGDSSPISTRPGKKTKRRGPAAPKLANKPEDLAGEEATPTPVQKFGVFKKDEEGFRIEPYADIDELMDAPSIQDYLNVYRDRKLSKAVREALTRLAKDPYMLGTRKIAKGEYSLAGTHQKQSLRRLSFRAALDLPGGSTVSNTRLLYSVIKDDEPCLAIYGLFKRGISTM